jgi:integrase
LQKIANIKDKHLKAYAADLKTRGNSDKTIKNKLSAIRNIHNLIPGAKYSLADARTINAELNLDSTPSITNVDRSWSVLEFEALKGKATVLGRDEIAAAFDLMLHLGLRLDEAVTLRHHHIKDALKTGSLHIHRITKGKVPRNIPLTEDARKVLVRISNTSKSGDYAITPKKYVKTHSIHTFKKAIQNFVGYHRTKIQQPKRSLNAHNVEAEMKSALTCHGLRHTFAKSTYESLRRQGCSKKQAKLKVSKQLGHHRLEITEVYLSTLN